ncbi:hypothetical protein [Planococcus lenghuensis]|uniref:Uncharacterized protein n=1 Tax=Planococcus lenghuensis TaxID=2213202 RepID=A0A1Q2L2I2_9BACL|nr:hypothetical protein [Planococcus lenghuensis]AQQ54665.1 hypothetical protein B0X71_17180 [Planococcus lenghuensis]
MKRRKYTLIASTALAALLVTGTVGMAHGNGAENGMPEDGGMVNMMNGMMNGNGDGMMNMMHGMMNGNGEQLMKGHHTQMMEHMDSMDFEEMEALHDQHHEGGQH